jgi:catechol 2,3-dioxygenase-like lactoylglutathione lyase family enzyme
MKRFHVHLHVENLDASIAFYSRLFAAQPTRVEGDYAKWMIEDPRINFAISTRGRAAGLDHLGFQAEDGAELAELKARAEQADSAFLDEGATTCCYAKSDKHWVTDPQGIAWEHYLTLGNIPVFNEAEAQTAEGSCCAPKADSQTASCCAPASTDATASSCCAPKTTAEKPRVRATAGGCCAPAGDKTSTSSCC